MHYRQLKLGRVVKALNFIGDEDNEITEVVTLTKHANDFVATNDALLKTAGHNEKRRYILGPFLPNCNPYIPV